jgi:Holliday junction resolvase RusA-like endonuclease
MTVKFTVPGVPVGKGRPRVTRYGTYTPQKTKDYEALVRKCWKEQSGDVFPEDVPIFASILAYFPIPKSTSKKRAAQMDGKFHLKKPDADNIAKGIIDAINGYAMKDDSAVQIELVWKLYTSGEPRTEVTLSEAINRENIYDKREV